MKSSRNCTLAIEMPKRKEVVNKPFQSPPHPLIDRRRTEIDLLYTGALSLGALLENCTTHTFAYNFLPLLIPNFWVFTLFLDLALG